MNRKQLKDIAENIGEEMEGKGYDYWYSQDQAVPHTFIKEIEKQNIQVEVMELERNDKYIHLGIAVSNDSCFSQIFPPGTSVIVYREGNNF